MGKRRRYIVEQTCPDCGHNLYCSQFKKHYLCRNCNKPVDLDQEPIFRSEMIRLGYSRFKLAEKNGEKKKIFGIEID